MHVDPLSSQPDPSRHGPDADSGRKGQRQNAQPEEAADSAIPADEVVLSDAARTLGVMPDSSVGMPPAPIAPSGAILRRGPDGTYTVLRLPHVPPPAPGEADVPAP